MKRIINALMTKYSVVKNNELDIKEFMSPGRCLTKKNSPAHQRQANVPKITLIIAYTS